MKIKPVLLSMIFLLLVPFLAHAQDTRFQGDLQGVELQSTKYAILVADIPHLISGLEVAEKMRVKANHFKFEIVITGNAVKEIVSNPDWKDLLDRSEEVGVRLTLCEKSMRRHHIQKSEIDRRFGTTPNGMVRIFELNDKGYNTVTMQRAG